jgi:hypothetical protein
MKARHNMGEIANDILDGEYCSWCGQYFDDAHGYPVLCQDCYKNSKPFERVGLQKAYLKTIEG